MTIGLGSGLLAAILFGFAAVVQAQAVRRFEGQASSLGWFLGHGWRDPWLMAVVGAYVAGFVLHAVSIYYVPLYLAQAAISLSLPLTAVAAALRLGEPLGLARWVCVATVVAGLVLLALGSGAAGAVRSTVPFVTVLWVGLALLTAAGMYVVGGPLAAGGLLGTLGGLGYAGSAIAVRSVGWPPDLLIVVAALSVPAYGVVAFWLYSVGLDQDAVTTSTGPLIVAQTFVPSLVGVLLLGDQVRSGWWPGVAAGLLLATAAAIVLSRNAGRAPRESAVAAPR